MQDNPILSTACKSLPNISSEDNDDDSKQPNQTQCINDLTISNLLASHLPDFVLVKRQQGMWTRQLFTLFIDINGFTKLSAEYGIRQHRGVNELSDELNQYLSLMVKSVQAFGGDIVHFAGDAVFCIWHSDNLETPQEISNKSEEIIQCAMEIHKNCDFYETREGKVLTLKTALSYGRATEMIITRGTSSNYYFVYGPAVDELQVCEQNSERTSIYVTEQYWELLCERYDHLPRTIKIVKTYNGSITWLTALRLEVLEHHYESVANTLTATPIKRSRAICSTVDERLAKGQTTTGDHIDYRSLVVFLRGFIVNSALPNIEMGYRDEYVSELREVTSCFVNLTFNTLEMKKKTFIDKLTAILRILEKYSLKYRGSLMKITTFDKGWAFMLAFGLPGRGSHIGNKATDALNFGRELKKEITKYSVFVENWSIGIATGLAYCGVIGHPGRHEYTCIGSNVNLSARLMSAYGKQLSLDEETYWISKLSPDTFLHLPVVKMKGVEKQRIRTYIGTDNQSAGRHLAQQSKASWFPFYGRRFEMAVIASRVCAMLDGLKDNQQQQQQQQPSSKVDVRQTSVIVLEGDAGSGMSFFLEHLKKALSESSSIISMLVKMDEPDRMKDYDGIKSIMHECLVALNPKDGISGKLHTEIQETAHELYCILKEDSSDAVTDKATVNGFSSISNKNVATNLDESNLLIRASQKLIMEIGSRLFFVILIDNIHFFDSTSIARIPDLLYNKNVLVICTTSRLETLPRAINAVLFELCHDIKSIKLPLGHVKLSEMVGMVSYEFQVDAVDKGLICGLYDSLSRSPAICLETIHESIIKEKIQIGPCPAEKECFCLMNPRKRTMGSRANLLLDMFQPSIRLNQTKNVTSMRCLYTNIDMHDFPLPQSVTSFFFSQYDSLDANSKLLLDAISAVGIRISRKHLYGLCKEQMQKSEFNRAVQTLMSSHILKCARTDLSSRADDLSMMAEVASGRRRPSEFRRLLLRRGSSHLVQCHCSENHTEFAFMCCMFMFSVSSMRWSLFNRQTMMARRRHIINSIKWFEDSRDEFTCDSCAEKSFKPMLDQSSQRSIDCDIIYKNRNQTTDIKSAASLIQLTIIENTLRAKSEVQLSDKTILMRDEEDDPVLSRSRPNVVKSWKQVSRDTILLSIIDGSHSSAAGMLEKIANARVGRNHMVLMFATSTTISKITRLPPYGKRIRYLEGSYAAKCINKSQLSLDVRFRNVQSEIVDLLNVVPTTTPLKCRDVRECRCDEVTVTVLKELIHYSKLCEDLERQYFYMDCLPVYYSTSLKNDQALSIIKQSEALLSSIVDGNSVHNDVISALFLHHQISMVKSYFATGKVESMIEIIDPSLRRMHAMHIIGTLPMSHLEGYFELMIVYLICYSDEQQKANGEIDLLYLCTIEHFIDLIKSKPEILLFISMTPLSQSMYLCIIFEIVAHMTEQSNLLVNIYKILECLLTKDKKFRNDRKISIAHCFAVASVRLLQFGHIDDALSFGMKSRKYFMAVNAKNELMCVFPYLLTMTLLENNLSAIHSLMNLIRHHADDSSITDQSITMNWYYAMCIDISEETGVWISEDSLIPLSKFVHHNELMCGKSTLSRLFGFATAAQAYARISLYDNARKQLVNAIKIISDSTDEWLSVFDPIAQRSIAKLIECQILCQEDRIQRCASDNWTWLLDSYLERIQPHFLVYPLVLYYKAVTCRIKGDLDQWMQLSTQAAVAAERSESVLTREWIKSNIQAYVDGGKQPKSAPRTYRKWHAEATENIYYILPV